MKHLDLFSGIGGFALAARLVGGIQTKQFVEIDPYCQKVLAKNFPGVPIHDDITTFTAEPGAYDLITGGFPCFTAGTLVLTINGYKPIESLSIGEQVLTHQGRWKPITKLMIKHNAPLREVIALGTHSIVTTNDHPFYSVKRQKQWNNKDRKYEYSFSDANWVNAENLTSCHYLGQVLPPEIQDDNSIAFWKMIGLYLADGWRVRRLNRPDGNGRVIICAAKKQAKQVESIISEAGFHFSKVEERTVYKYHISNKSLYGFLAQFGYKAEGKTIPGWIMGLCPDKAKALIDGLLFGDGWVSKKGYARITTVSQKLAYSSALLAQRAYGCVASVFYAQMPQTCMIEGRKVNQKHQFTVQITFNNLEKRSFLENNYGWKRIRKNIDLKSTGTVYNLTVADDNSYIVNGAIVHNCQDISVANPNGKGLEGKRSGLFYELMRIVCECRPRYLVLENVAALLSKHNGRYMGAVLWALSESGYDAEWQVISADSVGAPHLRERIFIVAYPKGNGARKNNKKVRTGAAGINRGENSANPHPDSTGRQEQYTPSQPERSGYSSGTSSETGTYWTTQPSVCGVADGVPRRLDRIRGLGNAVVPQVAAIALQRVLELEVK